MSDAWVFRDTRLSAAAVIESLEDLSIDEVIEQSDVSLKQIQALLGFIVKACIRDP